MPVRAGLLWEPSSWPKEAWGVGYREAPRGALGHWIVIKDGIIDNYQAVVPSTWNADPHDKFFEAFPDESLAEWHRRHGLEQ